MHTSTQTTIVHDFTFEAAHFLPHVPEGHKCRRLHGHNYRIEVHVSGELHARLGWVMDYGELSELCAPLLQRLDHRLLNDVPGLENPTSEQIGAWLWQALLPQVPGLSCIVVHENRDMRAVIRAANATS